MVEETGIFGLWYSSEPIEALIFAAEGSNSKTKITTNKGQITSFFFMSLTCVDMSFTFVTNQFSDLHWYTLTEDQLLTMSCRQHIKWDPILLMHKQSSIQFLDVVPTVLLRYFWKSLLFSGTQNPLKVYNYLCSIKREKNSCNLMQICIS